MFCFTRNDERKCGLLSVPSTKHWSLGCWSASESPNYTNIRGLCQRQIWARQEGIKSSTWYTEEAKKLQAKWTTSHSNTLPWWLLWHNMATFYENSFIHKGCHSPWWCRFVIVWNYSMYGNVDTVDYELITTWNEIMWINQVFYWTQAGSWVCWINPRKPLKPAQVLAFAFETCPHWDTSVW